MKKLHKNFCSMKQTVESMACGWCMCSCLCGAPNPDIYVYLAQGGQVQDRDSTFPYII